MIDIEVEDQAWAAALANAEDLAREAAAAARTLTGGGDIVVLLTDDESVRTLNARFRGQDKATNVLSFPAAPMPGAPLGDIALAFGVCQAEARARNKPLADHLRHLVIHGVLHLAGYDHQDEREAARMEGIERDLLAAMKIPDPYAELAPSPESRDAVLHGQP
jgi:probable rRNA maturation factor